MFYYLSLGIIFGLSLAICRNDIRQKKIKNYLILLGFSLGLALLSVFYFFGVGSDYLLKVFINTLISFLVSFAIWRAGYWPAGDSKYFTLMAFLLPLHYYRGAYLEYFPSFLLLANIFILFLLFVSAKSIFIFFKEAVVFLIRSNNSEKLKRISNIMMSFIKKFRNKKYLLNLFFGLILGFAFYYILSKFYFKYPPNFTGYFIFLVFFAVIKALLNFYASLQKQSVNIDQLRPRLNLTREIQLTLKKDKSLMEKIGNFRPDGLEKNQVAVLKEYFAKNNFKDVSVYNTIPFSLWIIAGVIVTIIYNRPIIGILFNLFK